MLRRRSIIISILFLLAISATAQADTLQDKLNGYQNKLDTLNDTLNEQKQQESAAMQQVLSLKSSIATLQNAKERNQTEIERRQQSIAALKNEQIALENKRQKDMRAVGDYLCMQYESGGNFYLEWLFESTSYSDLIMRVEYANSLINAFQNIEKELVAETKTLQSKRQAQQVELGQLTKSVQSQQLVENSLNTALAKQKKAVSSLSAAEQRTVSAKGQVQDEISYTKALIKQQELEAELAAKNKQQQAEQEAADKNMAKIAAPVKISATSSQLLSYAESFLGTPYLWGGTTPSGFDCSGYVQYVFAHFGVKLYRVARDQYNEGKSIAENDLEPGDLVFFSTYTSGPSHVGIYVGSRVMIDSSNNGVAYDNIDYSYWASRYLGARRVIESQ
jgi:cell wall-associated NlpC family hydrolase